MGLLDELRDIPERGDWRMPAPASGPSLAAVVAAGGRATIRPSGRTRGFWWTLLSLTVPLAALSPLLRHALATASNGTDLFALAATVLGWPHVVAQPVVLGAAGLALIVLAIVTRGFTRVTTVTAGLSTTAAILALVAAVPFVLVVAAFVLAFALAVGLVIALFALIIAAIAN